MNYAIAGLFIGGAATLILMHRSYLSMADSISKARFERAIGRMKSSSLSSDDLPSIVRNRYASFRSNDKFKTFAFRRIIAFHQSLEMLGIQSSLRAIISFFLLLICAVGFLTAKLLAIDIVLSISCAFAALSALTFISVNIAKKKKLAKFQQLFPDALDLVVRSVRAGLPVSEAIKMISAEVPDPVGPAFSDVSASLGIGVSLTDSLAQLATRIDVAELRFFAISLTVQQETGGNLAEILANLSKLMRKRVQVRKKIRALSSEARASALIIGSLPFIVGCVIFSFNRSYIEVLFLEEQGRFLLICALWSITTGGAIMAKLIRFRI